MAKEYDHLFKLLIIGDSGKHVILSNKLFSKLNIQIIFFIIFVLK